MGRRRPGRKAVRPKEIRPEFPGQAAKVRVLLATGLEELEAAVSKRLSEKGVESHECYYREGLLVVARRQKADVVVVSPHLPGRADLVELLKALRLGGLRVVLLPGRKDDREAVALARRAVALGVYDLVWDPVGAAAVVERLFNPATFAEAGVEPDSDVLLDFGGDDRVEGGNEPPIVPPGMDVDRGEEDDGREVEGEVGRAGILAGLRRSLADARGLLAGIGRGGGTRGGAIYVARPLFAVWNPSGRLVAETALNLAAVAAASGFDSALVNCDLACPELDVWFSVPDGPDVEDGAGLATFGESLDPSLAPAMLRSGWGVRYLPAGNRLGALNPPALSVELVERAVRRVHQRSAGGRPAVTVVSAGCRYGEPAAFAALREASLIVVPTAGLPQEAELVRRQLGELRRLGVPDSKAVELLWSGDGGRPSGCCGRRVDVPVGWAEQVQAAVRKKPHSLTRRGRPLWERALSELLRL